MVRPLLRFLILLCFALAMAACGDDASVLPTVPDPACDDGVQNGTETDVDCGGTCGACDLEQSCVENSDCASEVCDEGVCVSPALPDPTCDDGEQNGNETDVDCGGDCGACEDGLSCGLPEDCTSGVCEDGTCAAPTCDDGVQNATETDVDCGGACGACDDGLMCDVAGDCESGVCDEGTCVAATCVDGEQNGNETDVDCGGACGACDDGLSCNLPEDCTSGVCDDGLSCNLPEDCTSGVCDDGSCAVPTCDDGVQNGTETDVDCGGACGACDDGLSCNLPEDCTSGVCEGGSCAVPTCDDGVQNGNESDVDCGGACGACDDGLMCNLPDDCTSGVCEGGSCAAPTCDDGEQNGNETDVDCGGETCGACDTAGACLVAEDCLSRLCQDGFCAAPNTPHYGDGSDGSSTVISGGTFNVDAAKTSLLSHTADTLTVSDASVFAPGDEVLVITMKSTIGAAGTHEFAFVEAITDDVLTLSTALTHVYDEADTTMVQRVPHYSDLIVDGTLTASAWNGTLGGVVAFRVSGTLTVNEGGQILADGLGFVGGIRGERSGSTRTGGQGETFLRTSRSRARTNNEGGGGGGVYGGSGSEDDAGGGGGGAHATAGTNGSGKHGRGGIAGTTYGASDATLLTAGSGGGGGGADHYTGGAGNSDYSRGGAGGAGGGIIFISAAEVQLNGAVRAAGRNGNNAVREGRGEGGGGGGGAGGLVLIYTETPEAERGSVQPSAPGGLGGVGSLNNGAWSTTRGGNGGEGYVNVLAP